MLRFISSHLICLSQQKASHGTHHANLTVWMVHAPSHNYFDDLSPCSKNSLIFDLKISKLGLLTTWMGNWFQSLMVAGKNESLHAAMFHLWVWNFRLFPLVLLDDLTA